MPQSSLPDSVEVLSEVPETPFVDSWYELADDSHFWMRWRFRAIIRLLREQSVPLGSPLHVLDVGGGTGSLRRMLEAVTSWRVDLTELNLTALTHATAGRGRTLFYDIMDRHGSLAQCYDLVLLIDLLEHLSNPGSFLKAVDWHLKPRGMAVVNVPSVPALYSRYDQAAGHVVRFTRRSLIQEFAGAGFEVMAARHWGGSLLPVLWLRKWMLVLAGSRFKRAETIALGFTPPGRLADRVLQLLMRVETRLLCFPPLGASLVLLACKPAEANKA